MYADADLAGRNNANDVASRHHIYNSSDKDPINFIVGQRTVTTGTPTPIMAPRENAGTGGDEPKPEKSIATLSTLR